MNARNSVTRTALRWALAALAVLLLLIACIILGNRTLFSAAHAVEKLQQHLADGEGAQALGLMNASVPDSDAVALNGEVLKRTQQGITEFKAGKAQPDPTAPDLVTVTAQYKADGVEKDSTYTLRHDGKSWLFFDTWKFEPVTLPTVQIKANTVNEVAVNEQQIPLEKGSATLAVFYPAILDSGFTTKNFQADTRGVVITAPSEDPTEIPLRTEPTENFTKAVSKQVQDYLNQCATQKVLMPSDCPFAYHTSARVSPDSIAWKIAKYPTPEVSYDNGAWVLGPLTVTTKLNVTEQDLRTGAYQERVIEENFGFNADLETSTTEVSVQPVASSEQ